MLVPGRGRGGAGGLAAAPWARRVVAAGLGPDASQGGACSSLLPVTGMAGTGQESVGTAWQSAVNGNIAVAGTAPALAGQPARTP
ncbi:MAG: hypothetical protein JWM19_1767 [Actinomycetia bacterium]|nr:hypothetical protein [Actinomycetes bacterium]